LRILLVNANGSMSRNLKVISGAMLAWGLGEGIFLIFQPLYLQHFGADPILIGAILGINGLVNAVVQIPAGYLADKIGQRPVIWFNFITGVIATWMMALAPSLGVFVAGLLLYGLTMAVMAPLNSYVQGARGKWSVGRAVSFVSAAYNFGGILGPIIGGALGEIFNLRTAYFVSGVVFTISTAIVLFARKQPVAEPAKIEGETHLFQNRQFLGILALIFFVMFAVSLPQPFAPNFLQNQRGLSLSQIGQLGSLGALGSVLLMLTLGSLKSGFALMIGQVGLMAFALLLWQGRGLLWYAIGYLALGGFRLCRAMTVALARPVVRAREVGLAFGAVETLNALGYMAAPVVAGFIYDWQPHSIFPISLVILGIALLLTRRFLRRNGHHYHDPARPDLEALDDA
jgi:MFS family permease